MVNYKILLPPSEGKTKGGYEELPYKKVENNKEYNYFIESLALPRNRIYDKLLYATNEFSEEKLEGIFDLKGENLKRAIDVTQNFLEEPTKPAIERYSGVMFKSINYNSLLLNQKEHFDESVFFVDGMFGLLTPRDYIPEYKLKIDSKISDIDCINFWREHLEKVLEPELREKIVIDLLPKSHRKVLSISDSILRIEITFAELVDGKLKEKGHDSKRLKGEFIKYILDFEDIDFEELNNFKHPEGFVYSQDYSRDDRIVFIKE